MRKPLKYVLIGWRWRIGNLVHWFRATSGKFKVARRLKLAWIMRNVEWREE